METGEMMGRKPKRVAIYARVSTGEQTVENQLRELRAVAERHGWNVVQVFTDQGVSGTKGRDKRPGWDALWKAASRREFDMVAAWSLDRLGRSLKNLLDFTDELKAKGIALYLDRQGVDTSTPAGRMFLQILGVLAEYERALMIERVAIGQARAKAQGKHIGRPKVGAKVEARVRALRKEGMGILKIAKTLGIGTKTVQRVVKEAA